MKCISMGLNTSPSWAHAEEIRQNFLSQGNEEGWEKVKDRIADTEALREQIIEAIEQDGEVALDWSCMGATRFSMHASQWAEAMPEYEFEISRYHCVARKR